MNSQSGTSSISLLIAVCIVSIAFVAYYKVMFYVQQNDAPAFEKIELQQKLVFASETLQHQLQGFEAETDLTLELSNLPYFQDLDTEYSEDGVTWVEDERQWVLEIKESSWVYLGVLDSLGADVERSQYRVFWSTHAIQ